MGKKPLANLLAMMLCASLAACGGGGNDSPASSDATPNPVTPVKPGPAILYAAPVDAPQLQNTGIWQAKPILVSGASAYRNGEYLYQDYLYDDHGANSIPNPAPPIPDLSASGDYTYPTDPKFAGNAADLVELRIKPTNEATAFRVTYNSMVDPEVTAITIGIGDSGTPLLMPHGANTLARAKIFVTVHGSSGDIVDAASGQSIGIPQIAVDTVRRQVEIRVPYSAFDTRGMNDVRITAATGLWDTAAQAYLIPQAKASSTTPGGSGTLTNPSAFFNVGFRYNEPINGNNYINIFGSVWMERGQAETLATSDISSLHANVDFQKLSSKIDDDMPGLYSGIPQTGVIDRIYASQFEATQGRGNATSLQPSVCSTAACKPTYASRLQPYSLYVPAKSASDGTYGLNLQVHSAGFTYAEYQGMSQQVQFSNMEKPTIVLTPNSRGESYWYYGQALADTFEAWADVMRIYNIDMNSVAISGASMGGFGTMKLASMYPDLFTAAAPLVPCPSAGTGYVGTNAPGGSESFLYLIADSLRNVPMMSWVGHMDTACEKNGPQGQDALIEKIDSLGYQYSYWDFTTMPHFFVPDVGPQAAYLAAHAKLNSNPPHVTYVVNSTLTDAAAGLEANHAYWISDLALAKENPEAYLGKIDVFSHGFGQADPIALPKTTTSGTIDCGGVCFTNPPDGFPSVFSYTAVERKWEPAATAPTLNQLDIVATNIKNVTIDVARAKVDCNAVLKVTSDNPISITLAGCPGRVNELH